MCGIVAYVGGKNPLELVFEGLQRLEYRGYDSAGIFLSNQKETELESYAYAPHVFTFLFKIIVHVCYQELYKECIFHWELFLNRF